MVQSWRDLLFAHWPVPASELRALVPPELELESWGGSAWVGVVPFRIVGLRARLLPPLPGLSRFPETNLRTYVRASGRSGVYFFTLEAARRAAVWGARLAYRLPYHYARMQVERDGDTVRYRTRRPSGAAELVLRYRSTGPPAEAAPGSLEAFLAERYALLTVLTGGRVLRADIHHRPWLLQPAEAEIERDTLTAAHGIRLSATEPLLHFAARQDTLVWPPRTQ